jgi:hypothetical protein
MKRNIWLGVLAVFAFALATTAMADNVVNVDIPISITATNPCVPESVPLSGNLHVVINVTTDSKGGLHVDMHTNEHLTGTGATTGANYNANVSSHTTFNSDSGGAVTITSPLNVELIAQGNVPNFLLKALFHITVNPDGTVTASVSDFDTVCQ